MPKLFSGSTMKMKVDVPCASDALMTNASRLDPQRPQTVNEAPESDDEF